MATLLELLRSCIADPDLADALRTDPTGVLAERGYGDLDTVDLDEAFRLVSAELEVHDIGQTLVADPSDDWGSDLPDTGPWAGDISAGALLDDADPSEIAIEIDAELDFDELWHDAADVDPELSGVPNETLGDLMGADDIAPADDGLGFGLGDSDHGDTDGDLTLPQVDEALDFGGDLDATLTGLAGDDADLDLPGTDDVLAEVDDLGDVSGLDDLHGVVEAQGDLDDVDDLDTI